jgi:hypothetical protein
MAVVRRKCDGYKINISQINEDNRHVEYECIVCGSEVIPVVPNGKTISGENSKITPHFKHLNAEKCGQETFQHFWMKTEFIKIGDKFNVTTDKTNEYICNQILFEVPIYIDGRKYIPDATIKTSCGNIIHFEFNYSNRKKIKDYIDRWKKLNHIIVEVNINSMMSVFDGSVPIFKALYYDGKCFNLSNDEDKLYYETIGEYKLTKSDEKILELREKEIQQLDWLWDEIRKIKYESKDYNDIGELIHSISSDKGRKIAIDILSRVRCGGSILQNYVYYIKDNIDKHLKLLNLKYNGYLIRYETKIPRLIYDRIFNGIIIEFYVLDSDESEICQTYKFDFKDEILTNKLKSRIDNIVKILSISNDKLLRILNVLKLNNKLVNYVLHYKESTDYIDSIYIEDYRNKKCVIYNEYYNKTIENFKDYFKNINDKTVFINVFENNFIIETEDSYKIINNFNVKYKYNNIFHQKEINLTYLKIDKTFKFLPRYNFIEKLKELREIRHDIYCIINNYIIDKESYSNKIHEKEVIEITDLDINNKIRKILYPIIYLSNKCENQSLNIVFNKQFTKNIDGSMRPWMIKDFIEILEDFGITNINNIY